MIKSFVHKGLKKLWETGNSSGIRQDHVKKVTMILQTLNIAVTIEDMRRPSFKLHELKGQDKGTWSVWVNGNYRITFRFDNGNAELVDYKDYH